VQPTGPARHDPDPVQRRWSSPRALLLHLAILLWVPGCAIACYWQVTVALAGDSLGWLYSIEWPAFGIFGLVVWWNLIHDGPERRRLPSRPEDQAGEESGGTLTIPATARRPDEEDEALARYNDYLEALARADRPKSWRRR